MAVDDLDAAIATVVEGGGKLLTRKVAPGGRGAFGLISDPDGNIIGLLTGTAPTKGGDDEGGAGAKAAVKAKATAARAAKTTAAGAAKKAAAKPKKK